MKRLLYWVLPLGIVVAAMGLRLSQKRADSSAQASQRAARLKAPAAVAVAPVRVQDVTHTFESVGSVEAPLRVNIAAKVTGRIDYLQVREGDRVAKGQVLVRIDPSEVEAEVRQQQAALAEEQYRLAQAQLTQNATDVAITTQISQQQAALISAQADHEQISGNYEAQVDSADAAVAATQASVNSARANLANAQARYNRVSDLYQKGFVAAQEVDDAKTAVGVQQAALDGALSQLRVAQRQSQIVTTKGKADIDSANANVARAQAALAYAQANTAQRPAYQQSLAALRAGVAAAEASLSSARARRQNTVLASPLDGFVTGRYLDPGAVATVGQPILAVQYMRQVWVAVPVPEEVSAAIHVGTPARVSLDALSGRVFTGSVAQINPSADPQSRQFLARVSLDNPDNMIKPGTFAHVAIESDRVRGALVVPREAVEQDDTGSYVLVVDAGNVVRRRPVELGPAGTDVIAITRGVALGEKVVTLTAFPLKDGQKVSLGQKREGGARR